jgi:hypothetical protein
MASSARTMPNYYELLGLAPEASEEDLARAFARRMIMSSARPIGAAARICAAYETLRDARKRREYDRSIGLGPEPQPPQPRSFSIPAQQDWTPFIASARPKEEVRAPPPRVQPLVDPRLTSIATGLREIAATAPLREDQHVEKVPHQADRAAEVDQALQPVIEQILRTGSAEMHVVEGPGAGSVQWRRPALALGGILVGAAIFGTLAGFSVTNSHEPSGSDESAGVGRAVAADGRKIAAVSAVEDRKPDPPSPALDAAGSKPQRATRRALALRKSEPAKSAPVEADLAQSDPEQPPRTVGASTASLPLPPAVIARTIERIGYACGEVASTFAGGAPGVFQVNCTSGQSYKATLVHGRYHFRRAR